MNKNFLLILLISTFLSEGILMAQSGSGFEIYGEEPAEEAPSKKKKKKKKKDDPYEYLYRSMEEENYGRPDQDQGAVRYEEGAQQEQGAIETPGDSNTISLDIDHLFGPSMDTVLVATERNKISFRDQERNKYYYSQALQKVDSRNYSTALKFLNKSIRKDPNNKELLQLRGNVLTELNEFRKARRDFKKALKINPRDPVLNYNMASTHAKLGKFKAALRYYNIAIRENPEYLLAFQGRGACKTMLRDYQGSILDFNRAIDMNGFFTPAFKGRGVAKSLVGSYDEAISDFSLAIDFTPEDGYLYYYRGLALVQAREMSRACNDFEQAYRRRVPEAVHELKKTCNYSPME